MRDKGMLTAAEVRLLLNESSAPNSQNSTGRVRRENKEEHEDHKPISFKGRRDGSKK